MTHVSFITFAAIAVMYSYTITAQEIDECGPNAAKYPCGQRCEARCNAPSLPVSCKGIQCEPPFNCRCKNGFARDPDSNHCVRIEDCPVNQCAVGEFKGACGTTCEGTCASPFEPEICQRIRCSTQACRCDLAGGFVRNEDGQCVRIEDC